MEQSRLGEALALASSTEWEKRCAAVPPLVGLLGQQPVEEVLLALLLDNDTAVTEEAAGALLHHASVVALTIFARGWVVADDDSTLPQIQDHLYLSETYDWPKIVRTLRELAASADDEVREAAGTLLADFPEQNFRG